MSALKITYHADAALIQYPDAETLAYLQSLPRAHAANEWAEYCGPNSWRCATRVAQRIDGSYTQPPATAHGPRDGSLTGLH